MAEMLIVDLVCFVTTVTILKLILVLKHYINYHYGETRNLLISYCGNAYFCNNESGIYCIAYTYNDFVWEHDGSLTNCLLS